jgi:hypothetical protein
MSRDDDLQRLAGVFLANLRCDPTCLNGYDSSLEPGIAPILGMPAVAVGGECPPAILEYIEELYAALPQYLRDQWSRAHLCE